MYFKHLSFLLFFYSLICFPINNNEHDTIINEKKYNWIITNKNKFTRNIKIELQKNEIDSILYRIANNLENSGYPFSIMLSNFAIRHFLEVFL